MKNKKIKRITIISVSLILLGALSVLCVQANQNDFFKNWGMDVKKHSDNNKQINKYGDFKVAKKGIFSSEKTKLGNIEEIGKDVLVTDEQVSSAKDFYLNKGSDPKTASKDAIEYVKEENALYALAIANGFDVTQKEVVDYVNELKQTYKESENKEDMDKVISAFKSEKEYWEYEYKVYKKLLPIQKYIKSLEDKYMQENQNKYDEDKLSSMWEKKLENIKDNAVKKQHFKKVDKNTKIDDLKQFWNEK